MRTLPTKVRIAAFFLMVVTTGCKTRGDGARRDNVSAPPALPIASAIASASAAREGASWAYLLALQPKGPLKPGESAERNPFVVTVVAIAPAGTITRVAFPSGEVAKIHRASDGQAYALASLANGRGLQVLRLSGPTVEPVAEAPECSSPTNDTAVDVRGDRIVVQCDRRGLVEQRRGGAWAKLDSPGEGILTSVWISKSGTLWFGAADGLYERKGEAWFARSIPRPNSEPIDFFDGPDSVFLTVRGMGLLRVRGEQLVPVWPRSEERVLFAAANGTTGVVAENGRNPWLRLDTLASMGTVVPVTRELSFRSSVDDRGRVWGIHDGSVVVADAKTGDVRTVPMGAYAELDNLDPQRIVVLEGGPQVPAAKPARRTKRIEIRLAPGGRPAANAEVELCPRRFGAWTHKGSPCGDVADPSLVVRTKADAMGNVAVDDVPMGTYYLHWKGPGDSAWLRDLWMVPLRDGEVSNVGTIARKPSGS